MEWISNNSFGKRSFTEWRSTSWRLCDKGISASDRLPVVTAHEAAKEPVIFSLFPASLKALIIEFLRVHTVTEFDGQANTMLLTSANLLKEMLEPQEVMFGAVVNGPRKAKGISDLVRR